MPIRCCRAFGRGVDLHRRRQRCRLAALARVCSIMANAKQPSGIRRTHDDDRRAKKRLLTNLVVVVVVVDAATLLLGRFGGLSLRLVRRIAIIANQRYFSSECLTRT